MQGACFVQRTGGVLMALAVGGLGCSPTTSPDDVGASWYSLVEGIDGVSFFPPLGPEVSPTGPFDPALLQRLSVSLTAASPEGESVLVAAFDPSTRPALVLLADHERYFVKLPARTYLTDPSKTYRFAVSIDGAEVASSVLTSRVFEVMSYQPSLQVGVAFRIEGTSAVRARLGDGSSGGGASNGQFGWGERCGAEGSLNYDPRTNSLSWSVWSNVYAEHPELVMKARLHDPSGSEVSGGATFGTLDDPASGTWTLTYGVEGCVGSSSITTLVERTCHDGFMNQDETGVDCGGSCQPCGVTITFDAALDASMLTNNFVLSYSYHAHCSPADGSGPGVPNWAPDNWDRTSNPSSDGLLHILASDQSHLPWGSYVVRITGISGRMQRDPSHPFAQDPGTLHTQQEIAAYISQRPYSIWNCVGTEHSVREEYLVPDVMEILEQNWYVFGDNGVVLGHHNRYVDRWLWGVRYNGTLTATCTLTTSWWF